MDSQTTAEPTISEPFVNAESHAPSEKGKSFNILSYIHIHEEFTRNVFHFFSSQTVALEKTIASLPVEDKPNTTTPVNTTPDKPVTAKYRQKNVGRKQSSNQAHEWYANIDSNKPRESILQSSSNKFKSIQHKPETLAGENFMPMSDPKRIQ